MRFRLAQFRAIDYANSCEERQFVVPGCQIDGMSMISWLNRQ